MSHRLPRGLVAHKQACKARRTGVLPWQGSLPPGKSPLPQQPWHTSLWKQSPAAAAEQERDPATDRPQLSTSMYPPPPFTAC